MTLARAVLLGVLAAGLPLFAQEPRLPGLASTPGESETLIQRARSLFAEGNYRESAAAWQTVSAREPVIENLGTREAVRAFIAAGDLDAAGTGLTKLASAAPADLLLQAAGAYRAGRMYDRAAALYTRAREAAGRTRIADTAALGLAATLEENGKLAEALDVYRELQLTFREARAYDAADSAISRLSSKVAGDAPLTDADYEVIVDRLVGVAAFRRAVDVERAWLEIITSTARRVDIEADIVQHLYSLRANDEARKAAADFLKRHAGSSRAHDVAITVFRLDVREGLSADVERRGRAIMNGHVAGATLDDRQGAARLLAEYLVSVGQPAKASAVYDQLYKMTTGRRGRIDVLWRMAIASLRNRNHARAIQQLQQTLRLNPDSETERAATFWLAYAHNTVGAKAVAKSQWASLVRRFPFSYYGTKAAQRIGAALPAPVLAFPDLTLRDVVIAHPDYQAAALLSRAGMLADAAVHARRLNAAFRRDEAVALLAARASEAAGDYTSSSTLMSSYFGPYLQQPASNLPADFWRLAYPRAYWTAISAAAARHGVDPLLMLGLARQESHFDHNARSPVGAVGLFQVMPYTAAELDPSFSTPASMERLLDPAVSAELGAKHLAGLRARYDGALAPTIASYNADKERVDVWWSGAKGLPEELFIDSIPYQQTRAYVRQVLANYGMYQRSEQSASPQK